MSKNKWANRVIYKHSDDKKKMVIEEYLKGLSSIEIAKNFGLSKYAVWKWTKDAGINRHISEAKSGKKWSDEKKKKWRDNDVVLGHRNPNYKRGYRLDNGYISISMGEKGKEKRLHVLIAEKALGRSFKKGELTHHFNENKTDNRNCNLTICRQSYHRWLHSIKFISRLKDLLKKELIPQFHKPPNSPLVLTSQPISNLDL
jgi:hypothetical protein